MLARELALAAVIISGSGLFAQSVKVAATNAPPADTLQRAAEDAATACRNLRLARFAFSGACEADAERRGDATKEIAFSGAQDANLETFTIGDQRVLQHGDRQLVSAGKEPWTAPQGDAPDLPFSPTVLAQHFSSTKVDEHTVTDFGGRPAVRVHAIWTGKEAATVLLDLHHPTSKTNSVLETLARRPRTGPETRLEASVHFDPATKRVYAATLRFVFAPPIGKAVEKVDEAEPPDQRLDADGLRPVPESPFFSCRWRLVIADAVTPVSMPTLDAAMRASLGLPAATEPPTPK